MAIPPTGLNSTIHSNILEMVQAVGFLTCLILAGYTIYKFLKVCQSIIDYVSYLQWKRKNDDKYNKYRLTTKFIAESDFNQAVREYHDSKE